MMKRTMGGVLTAAMMMMSALPGCWRSRCLSSERNEQLDADAAAADMLPSFCPLHR